PPRPPHSFPTRRSSDLNSLADPYALGVSGGAAVGALLAMIAGAAALVVQSAAVAGALGAVGMVYLLSRGGGTPRLLLTGVVLARDRKSTRLNSSHDQIS